MSTFSWTPLFTSHLSPITKLYSLCTRSYETSSDYTIRLFWLARHKFYRNLYCIVQRLYKLKPTVKCNCIPLQSFDSKPGIVQLVYRVVPYFQLSHRKALFLKFRTALYTNCTAPNQICRASATLKQSFEPNPNIVQFVYEKLRDIQRLSYWVVLACQAQVL